MKIIPSFVACASLVLALVISACVSTTSPYTEAVALDEFEANPYAAYLAAQKEFDGWIAAHDGRTDTRETSWAGDRDPHDPNPKVSVRVHTASMGATVETYDTGKLSATSGNDRIEIEIVRTVETPCTVRVRTLVVDSVRGSQEAGHTANEILDRVRKGAMAKH